MRPKTLLNIADLMTAIFTTLYSTDCELGCLLALWSSGLGHSDVSHTQAHTPFKEKMVNIVHPKNNKDVDF